MNRDYRFRGENFRVRVASRRVRSVLQEFEIVERPRVVLAVPIALEGSVLLVKQYRAAIGAYTLELPAGRVREDEDVELAIRRELLEESGFLVDRIQHVGAILTAPHFCDERIDVFVALGVVVQSPQPTPKESSLEVVAVSVPQLRTLVCDGSLCDAKSLAAIGLAASNGLVDWWCRG